MKAATQTFEGAPYEAQRALLRKSPLLRKLYRKLLKYGGQETLFCPGGWMTITDAERDRLLARGRYWPGQAELRYMEACRCHQNSKTLWAQGFYELANGFALSKDGLWRPHSWVLTRAGDLIETTEPREGYFGAILTPAEIAEEY